MPLPLIPVAIGLFLIGAGGVSAAAKGTHDMIKAKGTVDKAKSDYSEALETYESINAKATAIVESHGLHRLTVQATTVARWAAWLEANERKVRRLDHQEVDGVRVSVPALPEIKLVVLEAQGLLAGGVKAVLAGYAAQQAALLGVRTLAMASTGAAIAGLSGAAAESASLAWLGGGAIAAGGGGVAAGASLLTGIAVAPALLIGGITLAVQGETALTQSEQYRADVAVAIEEMAAARRLLKRLMLRCRELDRALGNTVRRAEAAMDMLEALAFDPAMHVREFQTVALLMQALSAQLDTPLLVDDANFASSDRAQHARSAA